MSQNTKFRWDALAYRVVKRDFVVVVNELSFVKVLGDLES